ncbi:hypothetical protein ACFLV0_03880 [Chloroflexota bacterium]
MFVIWLNKMRVYWIVYMILPDRLIFYNVGGYPKEKGVIDVTVILSELRDVEKLRQYYQESVSFIEEDKRKQLESESKLKAMENASKDVPSV